MENGKQNEQRVPRIELPPPLAPKPPGRPLDIRDPKDDSGRQTFNEEKPAPTEPALRSVNVEGTVVERKARETKDESPVREAAGDATPVEPHFQQKNKQPTPSEGNAAAWIVVVVLVGFAILVIASQSSTSQGPVVAQSTPVGLNSPPPTSLSSTPNLVTPAERDASLSTEPAVPHPPNSSTPRMQGMASPALAVSPSPRISRSPSRSPSASTPAQKVEAGRTYVWRDRTYYIPPDKMQRFNAIKTEGRAKLAAMEKLANEIKSVNVQMVESDKRLWSRLGQQRDALLAQYAQAKADYVRPTADMDEFLSSLSAR